MLNLIQNMYSQFKSCVSTSDRLSECFSKENGVLQGTSLLSILFASNVNEIESKVYDIEGLGVSIDGFSSDVCR